MKKITKHLLSLLFVLSMVIIPVLATNAAPTVADYGVGGTDGINDGELKLGNKNPIDTATSLINTAMIFLGLIAVCIVLLGGFKWMTAGGGEEKITEAKKLMGAGVVGIIIILSAWGIAKFILEKAVTVTN